MEIMTIYNYLLLYVINILVPIDHGDHHDDQRLYIYDLMEIIESKMKNASGILQMIDQKKSKIDKGGQLHDNAVTYNRYIYSSCDELGGGFLLLVDLGMHACMY